MHGNAVVWIAREFVQSSRRGAVYVRIATAAQEAHNGRDDAFLAKRHPVVAVPAADGDRLGDVVSQQLVRLTVTTSAATVVMRP